MRCTRRPAFALISIVLLPFLVSFMSTPAFADAISFGITNPLQTISSGATVVFQGTITNNSGADLMASDFFFNFFNFNPSLTPNQLLGTPDFLIANSTTSPIVDLFSVMVGSLAGGVPLSIDATLEDIFGDVSAEQTVTLTPSVGTVPEPPTQLLLLSGLAALIRFSKRFVQFKCR